MVGPEDGGGLYGDAPRGIGGCVGAGNVFTGVAAGEYWLAAADEFGLLSMGARPEEGGGDVIRVSPALGGGGRLAFCGGAKDAGPGGAAIPPAGAYGL